MSEINQSTKLTKKRYITPEGEEKDFYCWICHQYEVNAICVLCPRSYHKKCCNLFGQLPEKWVCPECDLKIKSECLETRSETIATLSIKKLSKLLETALDNVFAANSNLELKEFITAVDKQLIKDYDLYVIYPMDFSLIRKRIENFQYTSTHSFLADVKWILHNSSVYNGGRHNLTMTMKNLLKQLTKEVTEIEICFECYEMSNKKMAKNWFCVPCSKLHTLVSAKLKGFPYWPAKVLRIDKGQADVRFFGEHDRAWVQLNSVYLLTKQNFTLTPSEKKLPCADSLLRAIEELNEHIRIIEQLVGKFLYAEPKTSLSAEFDYVQVEKRKDNRKRIIENGSSEEREINENNDNKKKKPNNEFEQAPSLGDDEEVHSSFLDALLQRVSKRESIETNHLEKAEKTPEFEENVQREDDRPPLFHRYNSLLNEQMTATLKALYDDLNTAYRRREKALKQEFHRVLKNVHLHNQKVITKLKKEHAAEIERLQNNTLESDVE